jgi:hypothetical protein
MSNEINKASPLSRLIWTAVQENMSLLPRLIAINEGKEETHEQLKAAL